MISIAEVRRLLSYDAGTGKLIRLVTVSNAKAGSEAGYVRPDGYRQIRAHGSQYFAHRLAFVCAYGRWPVGDIDHINGDRSDNRIENLREVTHAENQKNQKRHSTNTSGAVGVYWHKATSKWKAQIKADGVQKYLGLFDNKQDAIEARKAAEIELGFHENHGRAL